MGALHEVFPFQYDLTEKDLKTSRKQQEASSFVFHIGQMQTMILKNLSSAKPSSIYTFSLMLQKGQC